jgi:hypothetical protein
VGTPTATFAHYVNQCATRAQETLTRKLYETYGQEATVTLPATVRVSCLGVVDVTALQSDAVRPSSISREELSEFLSGQRIFLPIIAIKDACMIDLHEDSTFSAAAAVALHAHNSFIPQCGLLPVVSVLESEDCFFLIYPHERFSAHDLLLFSPETVMENHAKPLFIIYQLIQGLQSLHSRGLTHDRLTSSNVMVQPNLSVFLTGIRSGAVALSNEALADESWRAIGRAMLAHIPQQVQSHRMSLREYVQAWYVCARVLHGGVE